MDIANITEQKNAGGRLDDGSHCLADNPSEQRNTVAKGTVRKDHPPP